MIKTKEQIEIIKKKLSLYGFEFKELKLNNLHIFIVKEKEICKPEILNGLISYFLIGIFDPIARLSAAIAILLSAILCLPIFLITLLYERIKYPLRIRLIKFLIEKEEPCER